MVAHSGKQDWPQWYWPSNMCASANKGFQTQLTSLKLHDSGSRRRLWWLTVYMQQRGQRTQGTEWLMGNQQGNTRGWECSGLQLAGQGCGTTQCWEAAQWTMSGRSGDVTSGQSEGQSVVFHWLIYSNTWSVHTLGEVQPQTTGGAKGMY
jgi:hypothetical protein